MKRIFKIKRKKIKFKTKLKLFLIGILTIISVLAYGYIMLFESEVLPVAIKISEKYAVNIVSQQINRSVEEVISKMKIYSSDFVKKAEGSFGNFDVNTLLINDLCLKVSDELSSRLQELSNTKIDLPVGVFSGISAFSGLGPTFKIYVTTLGKATIDYETEFESVGINQINFQIFLKIKADVSVVNPVYKSDINVSRKIMLINTVFNGKVPDTYLNFTKEPKK